MPSAIHATTTSISKMIRLFRKWLLYKRTIACFVLVNCFLMLYVYHTTNNTSSPIRWKQLFGIHVGAYSAVFVSLTDLFPFLIWFCIVRMILNQTLTQSMRLTKISILAILSTGKRCKGNTSAHCLMYQTVSNCIEVYRNVSKRIEVYRNVSKCIETYRSVSKRIEVYPNGWKCTEVWKASKEPHYGIPRPFWLWGVWRCINVPNSVWKCCNEIEHTEVLSPIIWT